MKKLKYISLFAVAVTCICVPYAHATEPDSSGCVPQQLLLWDYYWSDLLGDIAQWEQNPFVSKAVIGTTVQNRPLYVLTIEKNTGSRKPHRIWIHARTHPNESEGSYVARAIVNQLLSGSQLATLLLDSCVFQVLPMLNPDGVQMHYERENANNVDLESDWNAVLLQPEVSALKAYLTTLMLEPNPVEIALNLHSASECKRYFVYHSDIGTTPEYAVREQKFIDAVRSKFPGGIEPYTYFVSWVNGTPTQYPESWFWNNYQARVLAMTYEDMSCSARGKYDSTAMAILGGIGVDLRLMQATAANDIPETDFSLGAYPNPFSGATVIRFSAPFAGLVLLQVFDGTGRERATLVNESISPGAHFLQWDASSMNPGVYFLQLRAGERSMVRRLIISR
jgi:hypothetical protein